THLDEYLCLQVNPRCFNTGSERSERQYIRSPVRFRPNAAEKPTSRSTKSPPRCPARSEPPDVVGVIGIISLTRHTDMTRVVQRSAFPRGFPEVKRDCNEAASEPHLIAALPGENLLAFPTNPAVASSRHDTTHTHTRTPLEIMKNQQQIFRAVIESLETRRLLSSGALDTGFSGDGFATFPAGGGRSFAAAATAVQTDGKVVVVGTTSDHEIGVVRFNIDG